MVRYGAIGGGVGAARETLVVGNMLRYRGSLAIGCPPISSALKVAAE